MASPEEIILYKTSEALRTFLRDYQLVEGNRYYVISEDIGLAIEK